MRRILLIGAGNIGVRHLQGLRLVQEPIYITVVDPNSESHIKALRLFEEVNPDYSFNGELEFKTIMPKSGSYDVAIIATGSNVRRQVTETMLASLEVRYIVFEKVLFQKLEDFEFIQKLLDSRGIEAYVNCPRRMFPFYKNLKAQLKESNEPVELMFSGKNWGLACNSIHRIDLFAFLTSQNITGISNQGLEKKIATSKRQGFIELFGRIEATNEKNDIMVATSFENGNAPNLQVINTPSNRYMILEKENYMYCSSSETEWTWERKEFKKIPQSKLTNTFIEQLLNQGNCELTSYEESTIHHTFFLKAVLGHMSEVLNEKVEICPIT